MFPIQIFCTQIKSSPVIQSWFKSNRDLDLPITALYPTTVSTQRSVGCFTGTISALHEQHQQTEANFMQYEQAY